MSEILEKDSLFLTESNNLSLSLAEIITFRKNFSVPRMTIGNLERCNIGNKLSTPYVTDILADKESINTLKTALGKAILIDTGCGEDPWGAYIAALCGAKAYIGVDPHNSDAAFSKHREYVGFDHSAFDDNMRETIRNSKMYVGYIRRDVLSFLDAIHDRTVSILASAMDLAIIDNPNYIQEVNLEFSRVISNDGVCVTYNSVLMPSTSGFSAQEIHLKRRSVVEVYRRDDSIVDIVSQTKDECRKLF